MTGRFRWAARCAMNVGAGRTIRLGTVVGFASGGRRRYMKAGGIGFIVGDGRLNYRPQWVTEQYDDTRLAPGLNVAVNYQLAVNPGFNADVDPSISLHYAPAPPFRERSLG